MPQKISNLLSRRQGNPLLQSQASTIQSPNSFFLEITSTKPFDNSDLIPDEDGGPLSLSVKIPERFSRLNLFYHRCRYYLWNDILPQNTLYKSFFVEPIVLAYIRLVALFMFAFISGWTLVSILLAEDSEFLTARSALTLWSSSLGFAYFFMVFVTQDSSDNKLSWKLTYILGEQAIVFNILSFVVFYGSLIWDPMMQPKKSTDIFVYNIMAFGVCPLLVLLEGLFNHLTFYQRHRVFFYLIVTAYLIADACLGIGSSNADMMQWVVGRKYGIKLGLIAFGMVMFVLANKFYCWKAAKSDDKDAKNGKGKERA